MTLSIREPARSDARSDIKPEAARLTRRHGINTGKYNVPAHLLSPELSYEWKRDTCMGLRDVEHQVDLAENHWTVCQAREMPGLMPEGFDGPVTRGGLVLMSRPKYLTEEAQQEVLDISRSQVRNNERRLGQSEQGLLPPTAPRVNRDYIPMSAEDRASINSRASRRPIPE